MSQEIKCSIIIAIRNNYAWTACCLDSLKKYTNLDNGNIEVILIDNASIPKMEKFLANFVESELSQLTPHCRLIRNNVNLGSYKAWNQGIECASGDYICIAHNDCIFSPNWLDNLINFHETFEDDFNEIGVVSPCTNYAGEGDHLYSKELMEMYTNSIKLPNKVNISKKDVEEVISKTYPDGIEDFSSKTDKNRKVNYTPTNNIATFCFLAKKDLYDKYGFFDEDFYPHLYSEKLLKYHLDIDGIITACCFSSYVHHNGNLAPQLE